MDNKIKKLVDYTNKKIGLNDYYLKSYHLERDVTIYSKTKYTLCMEWLPKSVAVPEDEDLNPPGTAVIHIHVPSGKLESIVFVEGLSYATNLTFTKLNKDTVIKWIEQETGLTYEKQFQLNKEGKNAFHFELCMDGIPIAGTGPLITKHNEKGQLIMTNLHGPYPTEELFQKATYSLTLEKVDLIIKNHVKLVEFPSDKHNRLIPIYGIEEVYITNDRTSIIAIDLIDRQKPYVEVERIMGWDQPLKESFNKQTLDLTEHISVEQAFSHEPSPASYPITKKDQNQCIAKVNQFLRQEYPNDSRKWAVKTLHRDSNYIHAILKLTEPDHLLLKRKLTVMINANNFEVVHYIDNKPMLTIFDEYNEAKQVTMTKEDAYNQLKTSLMLTPYYVYDVFLNKYVLCGELDCPYGIDATNGEMIVLNEIE